MDKLKIPFPVVVEGKYDKLALLRVMEGNVITTDGFGIFKNSEKRALLRALAESTPIIVMTDPDGAGGVIRSSLLGSLPRERVITLYVPRVAGVEKRKKTPSAEGVLGVEGTDTKTLRALLEPYASDAALARGGITASALMEAGMTGTPDAQARRDRFGSRYGLPPGMNAKAFAAALGYLINAEEFEKAVSRFDTEE